MEDDEDVRIKDCSRRDDGNYYLIRGEARVTLNRLSIYEVAKLVAVRTQQIDNGGPYFVDLAMPNGATLDKASHIAAGMQIEHDMHAWPNILADEGCNAVRDARERRRFASSINKRAIEIHAIVERAFTSAREKGSRIEHRNENDPAEHIGELDLTDQMLENHRPFIFVAVIRAGRDEPFAGLGLRSDEDRQGQQVIAPNAVVFEGHPIVAAARGIEIEAIGTNDLTFGAEITHGRVP